MTWQWLVYIWLWGKEAEKRRQARSCFWGSIFFLYIYATHFSTHTLRHFTPPEIAHTPQWVFVLSLGLPKEKSWNPQIMFPSTSGFCLRRCSSSQVGTGGCLFAGGVIIFRNLARTDDDDDDDDDGGGGGVCPDQKPRGCLSLSYLSLLLTAITGLHPQL